MSVFKNSFVVMSLFFILTLTACRTDMQVKADAYIRENLPELSPRSPTPGKMYEVENIKWDDEDSATVTYSDGVIRLTAHTDVTMDDDGIIHTSRFRFEKNSSSSSSSKERSGGVQEDM